MDWIKSLPAMGIALYLLEIALVFAVLYGLFRLFKAQARTRNRAILLATFPGTFAWVAGWIGVMFPVPAVIGVPFAVYRLTDGSLKGMLWLPAPAFTLSTATSTGAFLAVFVVYEGALMLIWLILLRWITKAVHHSGATPGTV